jgi:hypothetical protein
MKPSQKNTGIKKYAEPPKPVRKNNKILWWMLGIGGGLAMWLLFSSFKKSGGTTDLPGGNQCSGWLFTRGYWAWELLNTAQKRSDLAARAKSAGVSVLQQAYNEAEAKMDQTPINMSGYENEVAKTIQNINGSPSWLKMVQDKAVTNGVSLQQQLCDDAVWTVVSVLSDKAKLNSASIPNVTAKGKSTTGGLGHVTLNVL